ncbi:hypothetical protein Hdeb2414_s0009g00306261 [Helianthus debilis subsp. tardiflorus]
MTFRPLVTFDKAPPLHLRPIKLMLFRWLRPSLVAHVSLADFALVQSVGTFTIYMVSNNEPISSFLGNKNWLLLPQHY